MSRSEAILSAMTGQMHPTRGKKQVSHHFPMAVNVLLLRATADTSMCSTMDLNHSCLAGTTSESLSLRIPGHVEFLLTWRYCHAGPRGGLGLECPFRAFLRADASLS